MNVIEITNPLIENYLQSLLPYRHQLFKRLEKRAKTAEFPIIGPQVGMLLKLLALMTNAKRVIDLGSGYGYSALWLAQGLAPGGKIILTEMSEVNLEAARQHFRRLNLEAQAEFRHGDAVAIFEQESDLFDLIFNDVDKEEYPKVLELAHPRLRQGGLLITDNTLWDGKVAEPRRDRAIVAIKRFNRLLKIHPGFHTVQLPLRDGVSVSLKL